MPLAEEQFIKDVASALSALGDRANTKLHNSGLACEIVEGDALVYVLDQDEQRHEVGRYPKADIAAVFNIGTIRYGNDGVTGLEEPK